MHILYVSFDDLNRNGAWRVHAEAVVTRLARRGHEVALAAPGEKPAWAPAHVPLPDSLRGSRMARAWAYFVSSGRTIAGYVRERRPDVVYVRGAHFTTTPLEADRPIVVEVNGMLEAEAASPLWAMRARTAMKKYMDRAAAVVTVSPRLADWMRDRYGAKNVHVIPNGADVEKFRPRDRGEARDRLRLPKDAKIALYVGTFYAHHDTETIARAASAMRDARFVFVGDGPERRRAEAIAPGARFEGEVDHDRVPEYVAAADACVYLLRSPYDPGFGFSPIKLYEYMAGGRPVVAGATHEEIVTLVRDRGAGVGFALSPDRPADAARLADAIRTATPAMGERGRELAVNEYNWDRTAERVEAVLKSVA